MTAEKKNETKAIGKDQSRLLHFWLPAAGIVLVGAVLAGVFAYYFYLPYGDVDGGGYVIYHKKTTAVTAPAASSSSTSNDQLTSDLKAVDTKLSNLDTAASASSSSVNDQQTNINLNNF